MPIPKRSRYQSASLSPTPLVLHASATIPETSLRLFRTLHVTVAQPLTLDGQRIAKEHLLKSVTCLIDGLAQQQHVAAAAASGDCSWKPFGPRAWVMGGATTHVSLELSCSPVIAQALDAVVDSNGSIALPPPFSSSATGFQATASLTVAEKPGVKPTHTMRHLQLNGINDQLSNAALQHTLQRAGSVVLAIHPVTDPLGRPLADSRNIVASVFWDIKKEGPSREVQLRNQEGGALLHTMQHDRAYIHVRPYHHSTTCPPWLQPCHIQVPAAAQAASKPAAAAAAVAEPDPARRLQQDVEAAAKSAAAILAAHSRLSKPSSPAPPALRVDVQALLSKSNNSGSSGSGSSGSGSSGRGSSGSGSSSNNNENSNSSSSSANRDMRPTKAAWMPRQHYTTPAEAAAADTDSEIKAAVAAVAAAAVRAVVQAAAAEAATAAAAQALAAGAPAFTPQKQRGTTAATVPTSNRFSLLAAIAEDSVMETAGVVDIADSDNKISAAANSSSSSSSFVTNTTTTTTTTSSSSNGTSNGTSSGGSNSKRSSSSNKHRGVAKDAKSATAVALAISKPKKPGSKYNSSSRGSCSSSGDSSSGNSSSRGSCSSSGDSSSGNATFVANSASTNNIAPPAAAADNNAEDSGNTSPLSAAAAASQPQQMEQDKTTKRNFLPDPSSAADGPVQRKRQEDGAQRPVIHSEVTCSHTSSTTGDQSWLQFSAMAAAAAADSPAHI